jgi:hypothetical protein
MWLGGSKMTLEDDVFIISTIEDNPLDGKEVISKSNVCLAVNELRKLLREKAFYSLTDDLYEPETDDDTFLYLPEIYKAIDEVLGFTTEKSLSPKTNEKEELK